MLFRSNNPIYDDLNIADRSNEMLRGVAQLQTKINLGLLEDGDPLLKQILLGRPQRFRIRNGINGKGLKLIIVNDGNDGKNPKLAQQRAAAIANNPKILGLIGHYASDMSLATVDTYLHNKTQQPLAMVSPGSTTNDLTSAPRRNFFRTVF